MTWRHWAVLLPAAACVQASTLTLDANYLNAPMPQRPPGNLAIVFGPSLLLACGIMLTAIRPRRPRAVISAGRQA